MGEKKKGTDLFITGKNDLFIVAALDYMMRTIWEDYSGLSGYGKELPHQEKSVEINPSPFPRCYWAVRELGLTATALAKKLHLSQPAVSMAVKRGEKIARENEYALPAR